MHVCSHMCTCKHGHFHFTVHFNISKCIYFFWVWAKSHNIDFFNGTESSKIFPSGNIEHFQLNRSMTFWILNVLLCATSTLIYIPLNGHVHHENWHLKASCLHFSLLTRCAGWTIFPRMFQFEWPGLNHYSFRFFLRKLGVAAEGGGAGEEVANTIFSNRNFQFHGNWRAGEGL